MAIHTSSLKRCPKMTVLVLLFGAGFFAKSGAVAKLARPALDRIIGLGFKLLGDDVAFLEL
jgi:hypothetical protein